MKIFLVMSLLSLSFPAFADATLDKLLTDTLGMQGSELTLDGENPKAYINKECRFHATFDSQKQKFSATLFNGGLIDFLRTFNYGPDDSVNYATPKVEINEGEKLRISSSYVSKLSGVKGTEKLLIIKNADSSLTIRITQSDSSTPLVKELTCVFKPQSEQTVENL